MNEVELSTKHEIFQELNKERRVVVDTNSVEWAKEIAWKQIDFLLDILIELQEIEDFKGFTSGV